MSDEPPDVRWADRTAPIFAEVAEAMDTTTDLVMAAMQQPGGRIFAMVTPRYPPDQTVVKAVLQRDALGVLRVVATDEDPHLWDQLRAKLDEELGEP